MKNYFEIWYEDKQSMIETMKRNMISDLKCGYNPNGNTIKREEKELEEYMRKFAEEMEMLKALTLSHTERKIENWCKLDLLKRGVIEL